MNSLSLTLSDLQASAAAYWITLVQEQQDDLATHDEAAEVIDTIFDLDPCIAPPSEETEEENTTPLEQIIEQAKEVLASALLGQQSTLCADASGCFTALVRVYRSHQDRPYTILVQGGAVEQTTVDHVEHEEQVIAVKETTSVSLNLPGDQQVTVSWQGPCYSRSAGRLDTNPELVVSGGRISWVGAVTGTLLVTYAMPYDLLTIKTTENDCAITGLYHLSVDEISIAPPPVDDQAEALCGEIGGHFDQPESDTGKCYTETRHIALCNCSESISDSYSTRQDAPCPDGVADGSMVGMDEVVGYVSCGETDRVNDPEFYKEVCCHPPEFPLPSCEEKTTTFSGRGLTNEERKRLLGMYDGNVLLVGVGPKIAPCGKLTIKQSISNENCCDGVLPLELLSVTPETIGIGGWVEVVLTGGLPPFIWGVNAGYYFVDTVTNGRSNILAMDGVACTNARIRVEGKCGNLDTVIARTGIDPFEIIVPAQDFIGGQISVEVVGGIPPYALHTTGDTEFSNGSSDIVLEGEGLVIITIADTQVCNGSFTVSGVDACQEAASSTMDPETWQNSVCMRYTSSYQSLIDWCSGVPAPMPPVRVRFDGYINPSTTIATDCGQPRGSFYLMLGTTYMHVTISDGDEGQVNLAYTTLENATAMLNICADCP